jgi:hypothetical protein
MMVISHVKPGQKPEDQIRAISRTCWKAVACSRLLYAYFVAQETDLAQFTRKLPKHWGV